MQDCPSLHSPDGLTWMPNVPLLTPSSTNPRVGLYYILCSCHWNLLNTYYVLGSILGAEITKKKSTWFAFWKRLPWEQAIINHLLSQGILDL